MALYPWGESSKQIENWLRVRKITTGRVYDAFLYRTITMPDVILGSGSGTDHIIRLDDMERRSGLYMLGRMGRGKTSLMKSLIEQDMANGHGVFFLDPHGDAVEELQTSIPSHRKDDVIVLDPSDEFYSFGINPLACPDPDSMSARSRTYAQAFAIFKKLFANIQTG
jgi:Type IV secretion-system coupling protein DNA-binding domain